MSQRTLDDGSDNPPRKGESDNSLTEAEAHVHEHEHAAPITSKYLPLQVSASVALAIIIGVIVFSTGPKYPECIQGDPAVVGEAACTAEQNDTIKVVLDRRAAMATASTLMNIIGKLWLNALNAVVLPLIFSSMILAVSRLRKMPGAGSKIGRWGLTYYVGTTFLAVLMGVAWTYALLIPTTSKIDTQVIEQLRNSTLSFFTAAEEQSIANARKLDIVSKIAEVFLMFIPKNIFAALADGQILGVIVVGLVIGYLLKHENDRRSVIFDAAEEIEYITAKVITFLIKVVPVALFFLILPAMLAADPAVLLLYAGNYMLVTILALVFHVTVVYPTIFFAFLRRNPYPFIYRQIPAALVALGSASSAATLPVNLRCMDSNGVSPSVSRTLAPCGAVVNMDGSGILYSLSVIWMGAAMGVDFSGADVILIVLITVLSSIGTSPIPAAGIAMVVLISVSVGIPVDLLPFVIALDWLLDRFATATNSAFGDAVACAVTERLAFGQGGLHEDSEGTV